MTSKRTSCRRSGFTLIELIAVIAVLSLLSGLVFVGVNRALLSARKASLTSNLRQVHAGLMTYAFDNNNTFPKTSKNGLPDVSLSWQQVVAPYVGETTDNWHSSEKIESSVFHDPTDTTLKQKGAERPTRNIAINGYGSGSWGIHDRRVSTVENTSKTLALTTGMTSEYGDEFSGGMRVRNIYYNDSTKANQFTRFPNEFYCVFVDGHLEVRTLDQMQEEARKGANSVFFDPAGSNGQGWPPSDPD